MAQVFDQAPAIACDVVRGKHRPTLARRLRLDKLDVARKIGIRAQTELDLT
jgi:hypothetical protein